MIYEVTDPYYHSFLRNAGQTADAGAAGGGGSTQKVAGRGGGPRVQATSA